MLKDTEESSTFILKGKQPSAPLAGFMEAVSPLRPPPTTQCRLLSQQEPRGAATSPQRWQGLHAPQRPTSPPHSLIRGFPCVMHHTL